MTKITLRDYQQGAVDAVWNHLSTTRGSNPVVSIVTGGGKSLVNAQLVTDAVKKHGGRVICLATRKELLVQNQQELQFLSPEIESGLFCAGLKKKEKEQDVIFASIQSCYNKAYDFGERHLVIVDEAHEIGKAEDSMFQTFFSDLGVSAPKHRVIGLTATPYRTKTGKIAGKGKMFDKIVYETNVREMIRDGWVSNIVSQPSENEYDTTNLEVRGGEFVETGMQDLFSAHEPSARACAEIVEKCRGRKSIMVFCAGVAHAEMVCESLTKITGEEVALVTGETLPLQRESYLERFKEGKIRWLVNVAVLTTGFNAKQVDAVCVLRATLSPGLFAQIVGRGLRTFPGKEDCLILDFGQNVKRHGPIDHPKYGVPTEWARKQGGGAGTGPRYKVCPNCDEEISANLRQCECGFMFVNTQKASDKDNKILSTPDVYEVLEMSWNKHTKRSDPKAPPTLRVDYKCRKAGGEGGNLSDKRISEWVCVQHSGFAWQKAEKWWADRCEIEMPKTVDEAIDLFNRQAVADTLQISVVKQGKYDRIIDWDLGDLPGMDEVNWEDDGVDEFDLDLPF